MNGNAFFDKETLKAIPFHEVVAHFEEPVRKGKHYVALCPWHHDEHPSLTLYENDGQNHCHCFACGKGGSVIDYVMQHENMVFPEACQWLGRSFGLSPSAKTEIRPVVQPKSEAVEPNAYTYIPMDFLKPKVSIGNSFSQCLLHLFEAQRVSEVTEDYMLGKYRFGTYDDDVIFATLDVEGRIHNLKLQHYCTDPNAESFAHCDKKHIVVLGGMLAKQGVVPADAVFDNECLFGAHLLPRRPYAKVVLVESAKNAVIGACAYPQFVWVAAGSKGMLKRKVLQCLAGRDVMVYPDRDAIKEWGSALQGMADIANFAMSDFCEVQALAGDDKFDIADYIISQRRSLPYHILQ